MRNVLTKLRLGWLIGIAVAMQLCLMSGAPVQAATLDEVISMHKAGLTAEVIIKVLDATGMETPIDAETLVSLKEQGIEDEVLSRLADFINPVADETQGNASGNGDTSYKDNLFGGEGFHGSQDYSNQSYYQDNTRYYSGDPGYYGDDSRYQTPFNTPLGSIWMSQPQVYVFRRGGYVREYPYGQYYGYPGYYNGGGYGYSGYPFGFYPSYNHDWRRHGRDRRHEFGSSFDAGFGNGHIRVRIHF